MKNKEYLRSLQRLYLGLPTGAKDKFGRFIHFGDYIKIDAHVWGSEKDYIEQVLYHPEGIRPLTDLEDHWEIIEK